MEFEGRLPSGANSVVKLNNTGIQLVSLFDAPYENAALGGNMYIGANLGGTSVTTQAGLSATTPALTLYNPVGSGVNLVVITCTVNITSSPAAATGLMLAYNTLNTTAPSSTTDATMVSAKVGTSASPIGRCYRVATLGAAPVAFRFIGGTTGASAIGGVRLVDNINGEVVVTPGVAISIQATSAVAITASFTWKEVSILNS